MGRSDVSWRVAEDAACECALRLTKVLSESETERVEWLFPPPPDVDWEKVS